MSLSNARRRLVSVLSLTVALATFPVGVLASHQFSDVPDSNIYHADIDALADSGVTTGCGGGKYCPSAYVTREQMAAFMNRLGALQAGKTPVVNANRLDGLNSTQFARSDVPVNGHFNCLGVAMQARDTSAATSSDGLDRFFTSGSGYVVCPVLLPNGAVITSFRAQVGDTSGTGFAGCSLLGWSAPGEDATPIPTLWADAGATTPSFQGLTTLTDSAPDPIPVDNSAYVYEALCFLSAASDERVFEILIDYTVEGLPVP